MVETLNLFQIYHLKDMSLSSELFLSCSILQLTFYVISISYTRRSGFIVLSQQIYHIGFLILFLSAVLIFNEDLLVQNFLSCNTSIVNDSLGFISKLAICVSSFLFIFIIKTSYNDELLKHNFEYVVLVLVGVLGSLILCSSNDLLTAYLAMELQSVAFYLMAAFKKNSNYSIESGLKYFIVGSFASSLFLFGSSFIYGCVGSLNFNDFKLFFPLLSISNYSEASYAFDFLKNYGYHNTLPLPLYFISGPFYYPFNIHLAASDVFNQYSFNTGIDYPEWFLIENSIFIEVPSSSLLDYYYDILFDTGVGGTLTSINALLFYADEIAFCYCSPKLGSTLFTLPLSTCFTIYGPLNFFSVLDFFNPNTSSFDFLLFETIQSFNTSIDNGNREIINTELNLDFIYIGFMLVCLSLFIKLAIAPFHFWSLDVYEGSPNQTTFFFAVIPKFGFFVLLVRLCYLGFYDFLIDWQFYFVFLSVLSIFVGSIGGLEQRKLKSLLAYSSISHTGYLLLSFSSNSIEGVQMMVYYMIIFMISGLCFWSIYMFLRQKLKHNYYNKQNKELGDLVLLRESNPMLAIALMVTLFSIAGIPPLVGFLAKLGIFLVTLTSSFYLAALFSILFSVLSTFYYIRVIKILYFENVLTGKLYHSISTTKAILISFLFLSIILLCIYPTLLYFFVHKAVLLI